MAFKFEGLIRQGMLDGKQTSQLISEVKELMATSRRHSETLVRTAVMQVHDKAQEITRDNNLDILNGEQQISTLDLRTSDVCRVRDGKAWDLNKKPIGDHDLPYARPPLHPNCRSTMRLITKSWRELGIDIDEIPESTRASMDGQIKQGLNYEDWLKGKTPAEQDTVLGKGKADLWRRGVITFRDMLDQSGRPLTLEQLQNWKEIPQAIRAIRRKHWNDEFKTKTEHIYYTFAKEGIIIDPHGLSRFGDRLAGTGLSLDEAVKFIKETNPNYIDSRNGRLIRFDPKKKIAVIQSAVDGHIISFFRKSQIEGKDEWKPI
ncbi:minor capsid protein [Ursidibacter sp. B-7004-1]